MNTQFIVTYLYAPSDNEADVVVMNNSISQLNGVKNVASNKHVKSIVDIEYDPQSISGSAIVNHIKQQGAHVALIAM
ncbi:hypothetical protein [Kaarinaea lacus]